MPIYPYSFQLPPLNVQDIPNDGAPGEFLGINGSGVLDWLTAGGGGTGDMLKSENLSGLASYPTARTNLGLGTGDSPTFANLTLTSPSLSSSAPVTISQTWGNNLATFKALVVNAAGTSDANSAVASKLLELQVGGVGKFSVDKYGITTSFGAFRQTPTGAGINVSANGSRLALLSDNAEVAYLNGLTFILHASAGFGWASGAASSGSFDTILLRDGAANTLALRNGAAAQTFRVYGAYPDTGINYARLALSCDTSGNATISTQALGTYTAGTVSINGVPVGLGKGNVSSNIAIGTNALNANSSGISNTFVGFGSGQATVATQYNTGVGESSLGSLNGGGRNTAVGAWALRQLTGGFENIAIGVTAGNLSTTGNFTSGDNNIFIGGNSKGVNAQNNQIVIGFEAIGLGLNSVVLGNDSITKTALKGNVGIGTTSPTSKLHVALNPATNYTTEKVQFGNVFFGNGVSDYSFMWMGGISTPLTLSNSNYVLGSDGSGTILNSPAGSGITFQVGGSNRWALLNTGHLLASTDNTYDIGASGANRPRNFYLSGFAVVGSSLSVGGDLTVGDTKLLGWISGRSIMSSPADGYIRFTDSFQTNFNRLQFGGTSASFPALKRVGTDLQVVVANTTAAIGVAAADADLTFIEDRYRRKGAGSPEGVVTAPIGAVYHNTTGTTNTSFWVKESGTGNTGWFPK